MNSFPNSEIFFSQVREDPLIEIELLKDKPNQRVALVASGGCTLLRLLAFENIKEVHGIDFNPAQLNLIEIRKAALFQLMSDEELKLLGHQPCKSEERTKLFKKLELPPDVEEFYSDKMDQVAFGLGRVGRYEELFRELSSKLKEKSLNPILNPKKVAQDPYFKELFMECFERQKLIDIFGPEAVNYSMSKSFGEHFFEVFKDALERWYPEQNYFLFGVFEDYYLPVKDQLPFYLQFENQQQIIGFEDRLELHQGVFVEKIKELSQNKKFDLIQSSNITDWMSLESMDAMLKTIKEALNPDGIFLARRLNGDHNLMDRCAKHFTIDEELSRKLHKNDRSFFYSEVVVAQKI